MKDQILELMKKRLVGPITKEELIVLLFDCMGKPMFPFEFIRIVKVLFNGVNLCKCNSE
jgi:hypothetical protein